MESKLRGLGNIKMLVGRESMERHSLQKEISAVFHLHDEYEKCFCMTKSN